MSDRGFEHNVYAPPAEDHELPGAVRAYGEGVWRERGLAVAERSGAVFPDRCVVCNQPGDERLKLTLRWHPEWIYALLVAGVLPYFLMSLILGKTAQVDIALCHFHARRRRNGIAAAVVLIPLSIPILVLTFWADAALLIYVAMGALLTGVLLGLQWGRVVHIGRMDERFVSLAAGRPFLDSLPSRDGWGAWPMGGGGGYPPSAGGYGSGGFGPQR